VGWEKVAYWSTKAAISLKRVKDRGKVRGPIETHQRSFERYHLGPYDIISKIRGSQPPPKTSIAIVSGTGKATNFKFGRYIHRVHPNNSPLKILEKRERGRIQGLSKFLSTPYYLRNVEMWAFISGKIVVDVLRDSRRKFSGHPYYRAHRAIICAVAQLSC